MTGGPGRAIKKRQSKRKMTKTRGTKKDGRGGVERGQKFTVHENVVARTGGQRTGKAFFKQGREKGGGWVRKERKDC